MNETVQVMFKVSTVLEHSCGTGKTKIKEKLKNKLPIPKSRIC